MLNARKSSWSVREIGIEKLPVEADTSAAVVRFHLHFNTLAKASLIGFVNR